MGYGPQAQAGGDHALDQRARGGLPVEPAGEAILGDVAAVEEAPRPEHDREEERRRKAGLTAAALELGAQRLEPAAPARGRAEREQDHVLREHRELEVDLLGPDREEQMHEERAGLDRQRHRGDRAPTQRPDGGRLRLGPQHAQQRVAQ